MYNYVASTIINYYQIGQNYQIGPSEGSFIHAEVEKAASRLLIFDLPKIMAIISS